jgi:hypothetical protein
MGMLNYFTMCRPIAISTPRPGKPSQPRSYDFSFQIRLLPLYAPYQTQRTVQLPKTMAKMMAKTVAETVSKTMPKTVPKTAHKTMPTTMPTTIPTTMPKTDPCSVAVQRASPFKT